MQRTVDIGAIERQRAETSSRGRGKTTRPQGSRTSLRAKQPKQSYADFDYNDDDLEPDDNDLL